MKITKEEKIAFADSMIEKKPQLIKRFLRGSSKPEAAAEEEEEDPAAAKEAQIQAELKEELKMVKKLVKDDLIKYLNDHEVTGFDPESNKPELLKIAIDACELKYASIDR